MNGKFVIRRGASWKVIRSAWVYGKDSVFFCEVGQESHLVDLPEPDKRPFFGDQFIHTIEQVDCMGVRVQRLGGANNIIAANTLLQILRSHVSRIPGETVQVRDGSHVIRAFDCFTGEDVLTGRPTAKGK